MKRYKWLLASMLALGVMMTGCAAEANSGEQPVLQNQSEQDATPPVDKDVLLEGADSSQDNVKDSEHKRSTMMMGKIVAIYGNYIQIDKIDMPEREPGQGDRPEGERPEGERPEGERPEGEKKERTNLTTVSGTTQGMRSGQGRPQGGGGRGKEGTNSDYETSGEIVDVMIPVGAEISSREDTELQLTYDSLKKGMILRIAVDEAMTEEFQDRTEDETFYADSVSVINQ